MLNFLRILLITFGLIISLQCLVLILMGKVNFGAVVPFLIGIIFLSHGLLWQKIRRFFSKNTWLNRFWYASWTVFAIWLVSFIVFAVTLQQRIELSRQSLPDIKAVIMLGSGTVDGKPTPTLASRLDTAAPIIKAHPNAVAITSGGVGFKRSRSEADIMATYLNEAHAIPLQHILQEGRSTSTEENLAFSEPILEKAGVQITEPIAIVTSDFHIVRSKAIAHRQGYTQPILIASPTPLSIRYNAWFREYFAFISGWLLDEY